MQLKLTSFKLCPYAQMALLLCRKADIDIEVNYININQPPDWFIKRSPTGEVPMLEVGKQVIFDSRAIIDFLNETAQTGIYPDDVLQRAKSRAWMAFSMSLFMDLFHLISVQKDADYQQIKTTLHNKLVQMTKHHSGQTFFMGKDFSVVEVAITPFLMRIDWINRWTDNALDILPRTLLGWKNEILHQDYVQQSLPDEHIEDVYMAMVEQADGILATFITE